MKKSKIFSVIILVFLFIFTLPIHAAILYVATDGDNSDGSTWAKAYQTIQAAVTASTIGDVINVGSSDGHGTGIYNEYVVVNKRLTIQSENGYATTTVYTSNPVKDVFYIA